jgi:transposase InsO family protein
MNPNYLFKDELGYELSVRGIRTEADTQVLRKVFRSCWTEEFVVDSSYLCERGFQDLYSEALKKISELQESVEQQQRNVSRWQTQVQHLRAHLTHLTSAELQLMEAKQRSVRKLSGLLADVEHKMAPVQESQAAQVVLGKAAGDEEASKPVTTEQQSVPETVADPVTSDEVRSTQGVTFPPLTSNIYQKIPHPLSNIIKEFLIIDGSQISRLWEFIVKASRLCKKGVKFKWGDEQQCAFEALKLAISQPPVLKMADYSQQFIVQTDASGVALGAVISQEVEGVRQPIAYASRTLSAQERKASSTYELECLAVLFAMDKFRKYVEHQAFILETDNQALSWLLSHPRQLGKIGRWVACISASKFEVRHIRGTQNVVADALSHLFNVEEVDEPPMVECNLTLTKFPLAFQDLKQLQGQDPELSGIMAQLQRGNKVERYTVSKGALYWRGCKRQPLRLVLPTAARDIVFAYFHESTLGAHLGVHKTLAKIRAQFVWKGMFADIRSRVRGCHTCSISKPAQNTQLGWLSSEVAQRPLQKLFIDFVGKFPRSKVANSVILVCVDAFSKFVWLIPLREATTKATVKALKERVFASFSVPEVIVSDNAQCFTSVEFKRFCFDMGMKHITTSPYHPQPSHAERFNKNLRAAFIAYHSDAHDSWYVNLHWLQLAFNMAEHEATKSTQFAVIFPFPPGSPLTNRWKIQELLPVKWNKRELNQRWNSVRRNLYNSRDRVETRYNRNQLPNPFKVKQLVYYKNHPISHAGKKIAAKLMPRYRGPYRIQTFLTPVTVRLVDPKSGRVITRAHLSQLKPASLGYVMSTEPWTQKDFA